MSPVDTPQAVEHLLSKERVHRISTSLGHAVSKTDVDERHDDGLQISELGETVAYMHRLVGGALNVVLGGLIQGAAVSLVAALL